MIEIRGLEKRYEKKEAIGAPVLSIPFLTIEPGQRWAISGPSGSGKSTLLHCIAGLVRPTKGEIYVGAMSVHQESQEVLSAWRGQSVGYIFQQLNLLPALTVEENIALGLYFSKTKEKEPKKRIRALLQEVGLGGYERKFPRQLSIGEQQRVAAIRGIIKKPSLILADEPTASLDKENSRKLMEVLERYCQDTKAILLLASHDEEVKARCTHRLQLEKGCVPHVD